MRRISITLLLAGLLCNFGFAQDQIIDEIVGVVGDNIILRSDVETQRLQAEQQGAPQGENFECQLVEDLLFQSLLLHQADVDTVEIGEDQIEGELNRRMGFFIQQLGSAERLEEFYGKSTREIKDELRDLLRDQLRAQQVQNGLTSDVAVTPSEVRKYFNDIPKDSLPLINSEAELAHLVIRPEVSQEQIDAVKKKLNDMRKQIVSGEKSFRTQAVLYSQDGSAKDGGELGFINRSDLVSEFAGVAFGLKKDEISGIVETEYGFHLIQMIERRGEQINVRHILLKPEVEAEQLVAAEQKLDSIRGLIESDSLTFEQAVARFSNDDDTKNGNGVILNPNTGSARFPMDQIDPQLFFVIDKMEQGDLSKPVLYNDRNGKAYRIVLLKNAPSHTKPI